MGAVTSMSSSSPAAGPGGGVGSAVGTRGDCQDTGLCDSADVPARNVPLDPLEQPVAYVRSSKYRRRINKTIQELKELKS